MGCSPTGGRTYPEGFRDASHAAGGREADLSTPGVLPPSRIADSLGQGADISKAKALLDGPPETPIEEGLHVFADWVMDYCADRPVLDV